MIYLFFLIIEIIKLLYFRNLFYKIPIFILKDSLFVKPSESLQKKIRDLFRSISISSEDGLKFTVVDIDTKNLYRVTTLFQFYFNERVNRKNISVLIDLIKISFNRFNCNHYK